MSSSGLSSLSPAPSISDDEVENGAVRAGKLDHYFKKASSATSPPQPKRKRPASPPHEYVLADNADIAFIVMFRSRFSAGFPKSLPNYGPQDIERGVVDTLPDESVDKLLCALIGLVLNRKKDVEFVPTHAISSLRRAAHCLTYWPEEADLSATTRRGHYQRALEEAVQTHNSQWPPSWNGKNVLHGGRNFNNMSPLERLSLLKTLIIWALSSSEAISTIMKESYKQQRHEDDLNQPLSVQPWGRDGDKRRYWLVEGQDDTHFRLYRESNPALKTNTWFSVAGNIDELKAVAERLGEDNSQASKRLKERVVAAVPRFEASDEKRKRRDYRNSRKAQFTRPEPGFSLYEGRTRGKRIRYAYSEEEEGMSDGLGNKRSSRHSGISTPAEPTGPTYTASGRQVKSRVGGTYGETLNVNRDTDPSNPAETILVKPKAVRGWVYIEDTGSPADPVDEPLPATRTRNRGGNESLNPPRYGRRHIEGYNELDELEDESDASSSGHDWDAADDDEVDIADDEDEDEPDMTDSGTSDSDDDAVRAPKRSLVVALRYQKRASSSHSKGMGHDLGQKVHDIPKQELGPGAAPFANRQAALKNGHNPSADLARTTQTLASLDVSPSKKPIHHLVAGATNDVEEPPQQDVMMT